MWKEVLAALAVCIVSTLAYFVNDIVKKRKRLQASGAPQPPMQSLLLGHLYIAEECVRVFPKGIHSHTWSDYIREKWNLPEVFYIDWRPFGPLWLHMAEPELANEYIMTKQCLPKSRLETSYLDKFLGENNMASLEGRRWKAVRSMFNPGFSAGNIMTYIDGIVVASLRFVDVLKEKARTNELFELEDVSTRLTIDVIGLAVLDVDMQAQTKVHPIVQYFRERVEYMPGADAIYPWQDVMLSRPFKLWWNGRKLEAAINEELDKKILRRAKDFGDETKGMTKGPKKRSIVDLALNAYEKEKSMGDNVTADTVRHILDPRDLPTGLRKDIVDQVKTFIFAGHDTVRRVLEHIDLLLTLCRLHLRLHGLFTCCIETHECKKSLKQSSTTFFPQGSLQQKRSDRIRT